MSLASKMRSYFNSPPEKKSSPNFSYRSFLYGMNSASWTSREYSKLANEAYCKNVIAHRAIMLICQGAASVPWRLHKIHSEKKVEINRHPLLELLHKPNPNLAGAEFFENIFSYRMIAGNAYIHATGVEGAPPQELHLLRPDRVSILPGSNGVARGYIYKVDNKEKHFGVNRLTGLSRVLHIRNFNPLDDWYGMSSIEAAAYSIDQHNQASVWNQSLLQNSGRPSGAIVMKGVADTGEMFMTDEEHERLKNEILEVYTGARRAGTPLIMQGGLEWKEMGISPKDMDFIESKNMSAREIALALGVPPQLLGIPGDNTYSNMQEARLALWEDTIIPMLDHLVDSLNNWLTPMFGADLHLSYDIDEISGLSNRREKLWSRIENASFLTINEKRKVIGLSPIEGGDTLDR